MRRATHSFADEGEWRRLLWEDAAAGAFLAPIPQKRFRNEFGVEPV